MKNIISEIPPWTSYRYVNTVDDLSYQSVMAQQPRMNIVKAGLLDRRFLIQSNPKRLVAAKDTEGANPVAADRPSLGRSRARKPAPLQWAEPFDPSQVRSHAIYAPHAQLEASQSGT
ncbi:hypothetical protein [Bosea sp. (in: a-proteobacteria)]|uniref:hypothetical protein n=1 Tax=Bosea sp. (in: a-proteobacteria) TaxID=1871050 RepID=UPI0012057E95|nr:hypothetical protein [Bosea sp. (in: a-proteobacteria)]TAJ29756.1 MAG: hypothetical protein EPO59_14345 [Bosea sp. (in: a-proteobacteria)]